MIQIVSHQYGVEGVGISMQGGRAENQDDLGSIETPLGLLVVICDGMGGGPGGKTASHIVKTTILETFEQCSRLASPSDVIKLAVDKANTAIDEKIRIMPELDGMGSTVVMLLINEKSAFVAHLGDSRCYQIRNGKIVFRTNDHSLVGELFRSGAITEEQGRVSSQSSVITRGCGGTTNHVAEIVELSYKPGDRFVLCTDGVWGIMPHEDLKARITDRQDVSLVVKKISNEIDQIGFSQGNHHDNYTLAILEVKQYLTHNEFKGKRAKIIFYTGATALAISAVFNVLSVKNWGLNQQLENYKLTCDSLTKEVELLKKSSSANGQEIIRLRTIKDVLDSTLRKGDDDNLPEKVTLLYEIGIMRMTIDSLEDVIGNLQKGKTTNATQPGKSTDKKQKNVPYSPIEKQKRMPDNPKKILETCINKLDEINKIQAPAQNEVSGKVKENVGECVNLLKSFNEKTNGQYQDEVNSILNILERDDFKNNPVVWPPSNDKKYGSSDKCIVNQQINE